MHDDKWDEEMRKLFNEVEEEYDPASWEKLSERLDAMESEEEADELFDNTLKQKLHPYQASTPPQWDKMEAALAAAEERRKSVITTKSLEGIILLLLIFTLWNYRNHTVLDVNLNNNYVNTLKIENQVLGNVMADIDHSVDDEQKTIDTNLSQTVEIISAQQSSFLESIIIDKGAITAPTPKLILSAEREPLAAIPSTHIIIPVSNTLAITPLDTHLDITKTITTSSITDLTVDQPHQFNGWSMGIAQSYDVNFVNSDITLGYLGDQIGSGLSGHTIAITAGRRLGPIEINSGLGYSAKSYAPGLHTKYQKASANSSAFLQSQLDEISFKQLQVPLSVKLYAAPKQRTSFYIVAGAVANVLLSTEYSIRRTIQANARPATDPRANIIDLDSPPLGFGNGGNVRDNFYATGMLGFGVQSYLNNGVSWFVQPQYQHTLGKGINEVANEINTLSFSAGLSFSL